jgi:hypothetical protein
MPSSLPAPVAVSSPSLPFKLVPRQLPHASKERQRRWIVNLVFIVYWLLIFEGAMRKWALPGMHELIFFIRDPFVLASYVIAYKYKMWPRMIPIFSVGLGLACAFVPLALLEGATGSATPLILAYGWRNYFYYLPFAFLIGTHFRGKDLARLFRHTLIAAVPIAILCYQQFRAPATDSLNGSYNPAAKAMLVAEGVVRTTGTFTVSTAQTLFVGSIFAMLVATWMLNKRQRPLNGPLLWLASGAVLTTIAVSGARSVFFYFLFIALGGLLSTVMLNRRRMSLKKLIVVPAILAVFGIGYVALFPTAFRVMAERQMMAQAVEGSTLLRAFGSLYSVANVWPQVTLIGAGIGVGTNAGAVMATGAMTFLLAEDEWSRIVLETGVFGLAYIGYRIWLVWWLLKGAIKATKRSYNPTPVILFCYAFVNILVGQMTLQGTINGYGWLFAGFCMAANNLRAKRIGSSSQFDLWA